MRSDATVSPLSPCTAPSSPLALTLLLARTWTCLPLVRLYSWYVRVKRRLMRSDSRLCSVTWCLKLGGDCTVFCRTMGNTCHGMRNCLVMHSEFRLCNPASADKMWTFGCKKLASGAADAWTHSSLCHSSHLTRSSRFSRVFAHVQVYFLEMPSWTLGADIYPPNTRLVVLYHWWSFTPSSLLFFFLISAVLRPHVF